jgi:plastocyanin
MSNSSSKYAAIILIPIILVLGYFLLFSNNQNEDIDSNAIIIKEENIISINKDPVVDVNRAEPVVEPEVVVEEPEPEVVVEEPEPEVVVEEPEPEVVVEEPEPEVVVEEPVAEPEPIVEPEVIEIQILEGKVEIIIENIEFIPNEIIIRVGTIVTWINKDNSDPLYPEHTVSIDMLEINSPEIIFGGGPNEEWSHTFVEIGEFSYHCTIHPWMTGKIIVVD